MNKVKRFFVNKELKNTEKKIVKLESSLEGLKAEFEETAAELATYKELYVKNEAKKAKNEALRKERTEEAIKNKDINKDVYLKELDEVKTQLIEEKKEDKKFKKEFAKVNSKASKASEKYNNTLSTIENLKLQAKFYKLDLEGNLHELHSDIMRYKNNSLSFWLCILAIVFNVAMFLIIYKDINCTPNVQLGIDLLINIIIMLAIFLLAEKTKTYNKRSGYFTIGLGAIEILRIFWIPLQYFLNYLSYINAPNHDTYSGTIGLETGKFIWCCALLILAGLCLIYAGVECILKNKRLEEHLNNLKGSN